jgi:cation diffusion facilitator CzcD-associated flavoprotein CzcO
MNTDVLIVGASFSGLASASTLQNRNIDYVIIEKESQVATPWRNHYERLHLHTTKKLSNLPYKKFARNVPRYPSRQQVVDYLIDYQKAFDIKPVFDTEATSIKKQGDHWITQTNTGVYESNYVIIATGPFGKPKPVSFMGMETFPGKIMHSYAYKTGKQFNNEKVLVVGFGNSACEIAIDLFEQRAQPSMAVRSPVNVVPRDLCGIPILKLSLLLSRLPPRMADVINAPVMRLRFGDITKLGLRKMRYGAFRQIQKDGSIPVLDIGTLKHIREGHIKIFNDIDCIEGKTVHFLDGKKENFDAIIAAIGYYRDYAEIIDVDKSRFDDLKVCVDKQKYFGKDGLYFCGFWIAPTGQISEISRDAQKIAKDIARKERQ